jgi:hypothetical protein
MDLHALVLALHVTAGVAGLLLGPLAMRAVLRGRAIDRVSQYHWAVAAVCGSAIVLAALDWAALWWFVPIAVGSYAFALVAYLPIRQRWAGWRTREVRGVGGSYIALWTAVFVVSASAFPPLWFVPTAVGAPLLERLSHRLGERQLS